MAGTPQLSLVAAAFDLTAIGHLSKIEAWSADDIEHMGREYEMGRVNCVGIEFSGQRIGTMLCCFVEEGKKVFFVNAVSCEAKNGFDPLPDVLSLIKEWARARNCTAIRFWTKRPGLVHRMSEMGFDLNYVMEGPVNGQ